MAAAALVGVIGGTGPAGAAKAPATIIAGPGSFLPFVNYLTPQVVVLQGSKVAFKNYDLALHDVDSNDGLWNGPLIGLGKSVQIPLISTLPAGKYGFHCSLHGWMKGKILVRKV